MYDYIYIKNTSCFVSNSTPLYYLLDKNGLLVYRTENARNKNSLMLHEFILKKENHFIDLLNCKCVRIQIRKYMK